MTDQVSLDPQTLEAALAVLRREQAAYLPTGRQTRLYRAFNISAFSVAGFAILWSVSESIFSTFGGTASKPLFVGLDAIAGVLSVCTTVLLFLNWGLIRKFYRLAQLRRRLKLAGFFEPAFSAERKATRVGNAITMLIILLGLWLIGIGVAGVVLSLVVLDRKDMPQLLVMVFVSLALIAAGLGLGSLHFMRRAKQRLDVVLRLQDTLAKQAAAPAQGADVKVSPDEYAAIARLERAQIIRDRASSIVSARKEAEAPGYLYLSSRQMREAKSKLPPELLAKVEGAIAGLLADPAAASAGGASPGGALSVPVTGTSLEIQFDIDQERHLVRLHDLGRKVA